MKMSVTKKGIESKHEQAVRRGKNSKRKGGNYERAIAKKFQGAYHIELKRTPQSGGFVKNSTKADDFRGDITLVDDTKILVLHIECKNQQTWKLKEWLRQSEGDCPNGRVPTVVFHEHGSSNDYITLRLEDFLSLVPKSAVIKKRVFNDD